MSRELAVEGARQLTSGICVRVEAKQSSMVERKLTLCCQVEVTGMTDTMRDAERL